MPRGIYTRTKAVWNKGLTKRIDGRLRKSGEKNSSTKKRKFSSGELTVWNLGLTNETDEKVLKNSESRKGRERTIEFCEDCSRRSRANWENLIYVEKQNNSRDLEVRKSILEKARKAIKDNGIEPWNKNKVGCYSEETIKKMGASKKGKLSPRKGAKVSGNTIEKCRQATLKKWQEQEYVRKQMKSRHVRKNKSESRFEILLQSIDNSWKFVGDGQLIIGGKCPDFWNGDHKLIELYGDYWHQNDNPQDRIDLFKSRGYTTLIIWESELKDMETTNAKVSNFNNISKNG